jgi:hypothetical protein
MLKPLEEESPDRMQRYSSGSSTSAEGDAARKSFGAGIDGTATYLKMLAVLEGEARNRRQENAELRTHICQLQSELDEERQLVVQLRREAPPTAPTPESSGGIKKEMLASIRAKETELRLSLCEELEKSRAEVALLRQELEKTPLASETANRGTPDCSFEEIEQLRAENHRLRQRLDAAAAIAETDVRHSFERELEKLRGDNARIKEVMESAVASASEKARDMCREELEQLRTENAELRRPSLGEASRYSRGSAKSAAEDWDTKEAAHKAKACQMSIELANITQLVQSVLEESHEPLTGARSACVQLEAALNNGSRPRGDIPPAVFELKPGDVSGLAVIPDVLRYIAGVLVQASSMDPKWIKTIRYHFC